MSNVTFINDALSLIGVLPEGMDATAEQGALALRVLSELVEALEANGTSVSWDANSSLTDENTLRGLEKPAVQYALAIRLCPHFGREPPPAVVGLADWAMRRLLRQQLNMDPSNAVLPGASADRAFVDITS
jgi:hypothetical protein